MKIDRLLAIIILLLNRRSVTAREIAEKYEVSIRTIYRDIDTIIQAGIPVVSYQGLGGGYCIMRNYKISHQLLTLNDMSAILMALKGVNTTFQNKEIDQAMEKINTLVPHDKEDEINIQLNQFALDILPWGVSENQKIKLKIIQQAIAQNLCIQFTYRNYSGVKNERTVEPITVIFKGYTWYVFAFCKLKNDYRIFRFSRISSLHTLDTKFVRKNVSYENYMKPVDETRPMIDIKLKFSPKKRVWVEDYFNEESIKIVNDEEIIVEISFPEDEWVYSTILGFGEDVEVLEPEHIRKIIKQKAKKIVNLY